MMLAMTSHSQVDEDFELETDSNNKLILLDARDPRHKDRNLLERTWGGISKQLNETVEGELISTH